MVNERPAFARPLVRQFFALFAPLAGLVLVAAFLIAHTRITAELSRMRADEVASVHLGASGLVASLQSLPQHLRSLQVEKAVHAAIDDPTPANRARMTEAFTTLLSRNPVYDQVRWIDARGMERVRVDRSLDGSGLKVVQDQDLQDKSSRYFVAAAQKLPLGEMFISKLDLNEENGRISLPYRPTLRYAAPVATSTVTRAGILAINFDASPMLDALQLLTTWNGQRVMLLNQEGYWLAGVDPADEWGFMFNRPLTFGDRFPSVWALVTKSRAGQFLDGSDLWTWETVAPPGSQNPANRPTWIIVSHPPADVVRAIYVRVLVPTVLTASLLLLVFAGLSLLVARRTQLGLDALRARLLAESAEQESRRRLESLEQTVYLAARLAAIIESTQDAIIGKTLDGIITTWNPGAEKLFGYTADEAVGRSITMLLPVGREAEEHMILDRIGRGEVVNHFETVRRHKDGHLIDVSATISPIRDSAGNVMGASKIARDITEAKRSSAELERYREHLEDVVKERTAQIADAEGELRKANEALGEALAAAKEASVAKGQFLANMSHEIRTPMNAVLGFLGLVLEEKLPSTARRQLTTAHNAAKSLLVLLNDILDISKLQSGKFDLEQIPLDLPKLLRSCLEMQQVRAREKKLDLQVDYPAMLTHFFAGDPLRIQQIVTNLVGNAIKFTDSGSISLSVTESEDPGMIRLSVRDTGIGMAPEEIERIFTPFVQADSSTTRRFGGTGLGISITKQLAEAMGGRIWVESEPGVGSCFHVELRLERLPNDTECPDQAPIADDSFQSTRTFTLLLVDDIEENLELGEARLTGQGHRVMTARNGREAVTLAGEQPFDLILMDVHMPVMNGLDAARAIRLQQKDSPYQVPMIALTASVMAFEQKRCLDAGMNAFIGKPIEFSVLFRLMDSLIPAERGEAAGAGTVASAPPTGPLLALPGIDVADGERRWNNLPLYSAALRKFTSRYRSVVAQLRGYYAASDWQAADETVHALKGAAGNLSVTEVAQIASDLGDAIRERQTGETEALIAKLAAAWDEAAASIAQFQAHHGSDAAAIAEAAGEQAVIEVNAASLNELEVALEADDPGTVEPVLDRLAPNLPPRDLAQLRQLIQDYEFKRARALVASFIPAKVTSSRLV